MAPSDDPMRALARRNDRVLVACALVVAAMVGASYAAVPLYRLFCQVTGFNGTTQVAKSAPGAVEGPVFTVRFDTNVNGINWRFTPEQTLLRVKPGEQALAFFKAVSHAVTPTTGTATYNVAPDLAGQYFKKIQCFCFNEQTLQPGQSVDMPVTFFVDPAILNDPDLKTMRTITLSYTFYPAADAQPASGARKDDVRFGAAGAQTETGANKGS